MPSSASPSPSTSDSSKPSLSGGGYVSGRRKSRRAQSLIMPICENFVYSITCKSQFSPHIVRQPITSRCRSRLRKQLLHSRVISNSREISCKPSFASALYTLARIALILESARSGLEYMLSTFCLRILYKYSPWVTAGYGEFSEEVKSLACSPGEERQRRCSLQRCTPAVLEIETVVLGR